MPATRLAARPFLGHFNSTAFHARDPVAFAKDPQMLAFQRRAEVLEGQMPDDPAPCFAIAAGVDPRKPFFIGRQPAELVMSERRAEDPAVDDSEGWIAMFQRHLAEDEGLIVTEWENPAAPEEVLTWVMTGDGVRCYLMRD